MSEKICNKCNLTIEGQSVTLQQLNYHPECFVCFGCRESMKGKACHIVDNQIYDPDCFTKSCAEKCDICFAPITGDNLKFLRCGPKTYHMDCYVCNECKKSLQNVQYVIAENFKRVCVPCSEKNKLVNSN